VIDESALIGGRERREIVIADYDPEWPRRFARERERIAAVLGERAFRIEHVGSTAVPGLGAKPIVDVLVAVTEPEDASLTAALDAAGYELRVREPAHRMFRTPARDVHVHLWAQNDPEIARTLRFRDRLRSDLAERSAYEALKRELAAREWSDMNEYAEAKSPLIEEILARPTSGL
jgi:GrpB-like predicted nucleotidyltransferase (UPF0157 family)